MKHEKTHITKFIWLIVLVLCLTSCRSAQELTGKNWQHNIQTKLEQLTSVPMMDSTLVGICVYDLTEGKMLFSLNADQRLRPASNMKLMTAITALDVLGADYQYQPTVVKPGWGWCWDDAETGIRDFNQTGQRKNCDTLYKEKGTWTLLQVLRPMMKKSDNMLAESMFWQLPGKSKTQNITRKDCAAQVEKLIRKVGLNPNNYTVADGSGVSLYNYLSPNLLNAMLRYAYSKKEIYENLYPALPIAGVDGTLAKRMKGTAAQGNVHAKTGTVTGVSTLSGYCTAPNGHLLCFSIMNSGLSKSSQGRNFQDHVCEALCGKNGKKSKK